MSNQQNYKKSAPSINTEGEHLIKWDARKRPENAKYLNELLTLGYLDGLSAGEVYNSDTYTL